MSEELKYCKFCDKEKPIKEFCKSGFAIKNICRECQNKKQKKQYRDAKILTELEEKIDKAIEYIRENKVYAELEDYMKNGDYYVKVDELLEILGDKE